MNLTLDEIWGQVERRSPWPRRQLVAGLRAFLNTLDNPHACCLTGRATSGTADYKSAVLLELRIAEEFRAERLTKLDAADWLRLVFDAQRELPISNAIIHQTRLADVLPPDSSPFSLKVRISAQRER